MSCSGILEMNRVFSWGEVYGVASFRSTKWCWKTEWCFWKWLKTNIHHIQTSPRKSPCLLSGSFHQTIERLLVFHRSSIHFQGKVDDPWMDPEFAEQVHQQAFQLPVPSKITHYESFSYISMVVLVSAIQISYPIRIILYHIFVLIYWIYYQMWYFMICSIHHSIWWTEFCFRNSWFFHVPTKYACIHGLATKLSHISQSMRIVFRSPSHKSPGFYNIQQDARMNKAFGIDSSKLSQCLWIAVMGCDRFLKWISQNCIAGKKQYIKDITRWWLHTFFVLTSTWGNDANLTIIFFFRTGLKPPKAMEIACGTGRPPALGGTWRMSFLVETCADDMWLQIASNTMPSAEVFSPNYQLIWHRWYMMIWWS